MPIAPIDPIVNGESGLSVRKKLNTLISAAIDGTLGGVTREELENLLDRDAPDRIENFTLTSTLEPTPQLIAAWHPSLADDLAYYEVEIKEEDGGYINRPTASTVFPIPMTPNTEYTGHARAVDTSGNKGDWSLEFTHVSAKDLIPPATPIDFKGVGSFSAAWLEWTRNTESDLARYEIFEAEDESLVPDIDTPGTYLSLSNTFVRSGLESGVFRSYWVRAVDTSENVSPWSEVVTLETTSASGVTTDDLRGLIDATSFATSIAVPGIGAVLPEPPFTAETPKTFYLTTENKIYRQNDAGDGWTASVDAEQIVGELVAGQIGVGAIGADQIAANAVAVKALAVMDWTNLFGNSQFKDATFDGWASPDATIAQRGGAGALATMPAAHAMATNVRSLAAGSNVADFMYDADVAVKPGDAFHMSADVAGDAGAAGGRASVYVRWFGPDNTAGTPWTEAYRTLTEDWQVSSAIFTAPAGATSMRFGLRITGPMTNGVVYATNFRASRAGTSELFVDGSIKANHLTSGEVITLSAQIRDAIIDNAKILSLSAVKLIAGTALAASITVGGNPLSAISANAMDPAARINAASTQIDPGKILISGSTTLASWRSGTDTTRINGGSIAANSILANKLEIGSRGISVEGLRFSYNKSENEISWTSGIIRYTRDDGTATGDPDGYVNIAAGVASWTSGTLFVYWNKGSADPANGASATLSASTNAATANGANTLVLATYRGGINCVVNYGQTIIDGSTIFTGTITALQIGADAVLAQHVAANTIGARQLVLADFSNIFVDYDFADPKAYSAPTGISFSGTASGTRGKNQMRLAPQSAGQDMSSYSGFYPIEALSDFYAEVSASTDNVASARARVEVQLASVDSSGVYTTTRSVIPADKTQVSSTARTGVAFTTTATERAFRVRFRRLGDGTGSAWFGGMLVRRKYGGSLIVDGSITADKLSVTRLDAITAVLGNVDISAAYIGTLIVGKSNISPGAVTDVDSFYSSSSADLTTSSTVTVADVAVTVAAGEKVILSGMVNVTTSSENNDVDFYVQCFRNGTAFGMRQPARAITSLGVAGNGNPNGAPPSVVLYGWRSTNPQTFTVMTQDTPGAGTFTYTLRVTRDTQGNYQLANTNLRFLCALVCKR